MTTKISTILVVLFSFVLSLGAQADRSSSELRISYFSQAAIQPGIKLGLQVPLKRFTGKKRNTDLLLSPQIAFYNSRGVHSTGIMNVGVGLRSRKQEKRFFFSVLPSLGWYYQSRISSVQVNLETGEQEKNRESQSYFLSSLEFAIGGKISQKVNWFTSFSYGLRFSANTDQTGLFFFEAGITVPLKI